MDTIITFKEILKADLNDAIEKQEQESNETFNSGREQALNYVIEMYDKIFDKKMERLFELAHEGLPNNCLEGHDSSELKFCTKRNGQGNECKNCSVFK